MMKRSAVVLCVVISLAGGALAQSRTGRAARSVTNAELEKFRQKRLAADREYREHYAEMGFPSPEELSAQIDREKEARSQLAEQLRQARLESERLDIERGRLRLDAARLQAEMDASQRPETDDGLYYGGFGYGGYYGGFGGYRNPFFGGGFGFGRRGFGAIPLIRYTPGGVVSAGYYYRPRFVPPFPRGGRLPATIGGGRGGIVFHGPGGTIRHR